MRIVAVFVLFAATACSNQGYYGDTPSIQPRMPSENVVVEHEAGDMICVTENGNAENRSCVPRVHEEE